MIKKIWLSLFSVFAIFWFWVSFANPIAPTLYCNMFKNVEIDSYRVIIEYSERNRVYKSNRPLWSVAYKHNNLEREVYEPKTKECTKCFNSRHIQSRVYLLDKSVNIWDITQENIDDKAVFVWEINNFECSNSYYDKVNTYKITKSWNSYNLELSKTTDEKIKRKIKNNLNVFPYAWLVTIIIETICLFLIAKTKWKGEQISNKKIIIFWIIPTTISLPLFWFILPLLMWIWIWYTVFWELFVILLEIIIIKYWLSVSRRKAVKVSIFCNTISFILWAFIIEWLDWLVY